MWSNTPLLCITPVSRVIPDVKVKVFVFTDISEVEFGMRILRKWLADDVAVLDLTAVAEAEVILKVGAGQEIAFQESIFSQSQWHQHAWQLLFNGVGCVFMHRLHIMNRLFGTQFKQCHCLWLQVHVDGTIVSGQDARHCQQSKPGGL